MKQQSAPYDAYAVEQARTLGGWPDAALMAELSRRTTYQSDQHIGIDHTGAGVRFFLRHPIAVSYNASTQQFTVEARDLRYDMGTGLVEPDSACLALQGEFQVEGANPAWLFSEPSSMQSPATIVIGYRPVYPEHPEDPTPGNISYALKFYDPEGLAVDDTDSVLDDGRFVRLVSLQLSVTGIIQIDSDARNAHVSVRYEPPAAETWLEFLDDTSTLKLHNFDNRTSNISWEVPAETDDALIGAGYKRGASNPSLDLEDNEDWQMPPVLVCRITTDEDGALVKIVPYTRRQQAPARAPIVIAKVTNHTPGNKTCIIQVWEGEFYSDAAAGTEASPDLVVQTGHLIQVNAADDFTGDYFMARRLPSGIYELLNPGWQAT